MWDVMAISAGREIKTPWQKLLLLLPNLAIWKHRIKHSQDKTSLTFPTVLIRCHSLDAEKWKAWPRVCSPARGSLRGILIAVIWAAPSCSQCRQANILLFSFTAPERVTPRWWCLHFNEPTICKQWRDCALQTVTRPLPPRLHCRYTSYCVTSLEIAIPWRLTLSVRRVIEPPKKLVQGMTCFLARGLSINVFPQLDHGVTCSKPGCAGAE